MIRCFSIALASICVAGCASGGGVRTFSVGGQEVLGTKFILCKSQVKWDGTNINVEGLEATPASTATTSKVFKVGKLGMTPQEVHKLDNMALLINGWFVEKCQVATLHYGTPALTPFLDKMTDQTLTMMQLLAQLETINQQSQDDPKATVEKQQAATNAAIQKVKGS